MFKIFLSEAITESGTLITSIVTVKQIIAKLTPEIKLMMY